MQNQNSKLKVILAAIMGNIVEYYDFGIYAVFASIIGRLFFHAEDSATQLLLTFSVFSVGFLMRPLGGMVFGYIGDKFGRKKALIVSMVGMSLSTLCIGLLPSYESIGIAAPIALVIIRMIQGVCIGGEGSGSAIFIMEHMEKSRVSLVGSMIMASNIIGTLVANIVAMLLDSVIGIDDETWRYCFFLGSFLGIIGLYFRIKNKETPAFEKMKENMDVKKLPVSDVIHKKKYALLSVFSIAACATSIAYLVRGYLGTFMHEVMGYNEYIALHYTVFTLSCFVVLLLIFGYLTDVLGTKYILNFGAIGTFFGILPIWQMVIDGGMETYFGLFGIAILGAAMGAPAYSHAIKSFPPEIRYSGIALGWNLGNAIFGGTTPVICTLLVRELGKTGPCYYLMFTAAIFIILRIIASLYAKKIKLPKKRQT